MGGKMYRVGLLILVSAIVPTTAFAENNVSELEVLHGSITSGQLGNSVSSAGDVNGDGYEDWLIGEYQYSTGALVAAGGMSLIYGQSTPLTSEDLVDNAIHFNGETSADWFGYDVAGVGDVNADGYDDMLIGALFNDDGANAAGAAYLIYGQASQLSGLLDTAIKFNSTEAFEGLGYDVEPAGDVNADGFADMLVSAYLSDSGANNAGAVYLIYGKADYFTSATINDVGIRFTGLAGNDQLGTSLASGDFNNDGYSDFIMGAQGLDPNGNNSAGGAYIVYGKSQVFTATNVSTLPVLSGENASDKAGATSAGVGDVNGDTYDDIVLGAYGYNAGSNNGAVYIIYGQDTQLTSTSLSAKPRILGEQANDQLGIGLGGKGDANGDGINDIIIGASQVDTLGDNTNNGKAYIIYGKSQTLTSGVVNTLADLSFEGEVAGDNAGADVGFVNLNGDAYAEIIIGASGNDYTAVNAGAAFVGYLFVDSDNDGVLNDDGLIDQGTDCDDANGNVSTNQTYYPDSDGDGLGVNGDTITICSDVPPTGYTDNINDTNDSIKNNGIEIAYDGIDNDADGKIDEKNILKNNGKHPEYAGTALKSKDKYEDSVISVKPASRGRIFVEYADNSIYSYRIFVSQHYRKTIIQQYPNKGYYIVMDPYGKKFALVNIYNGKVFTKKSLGKKLYNKNSIIVQNIRNDNTSEIIVTSKQHNKVRLSIAKILLKKKKFKDLQSVTLESPNVVVNQTTLINNTIDLRDTIQAIESYVVDENYNLIKL